MEKNNTAQQLSTLPTWAQKLELTNEELNNLVKRGQSTSLEPRDQALYDGALSFSNKYQISFELCCTYALDLYFERSVTEVDVESHLKKKFSSSFNDPFQRTLPRNCKTIMLVGRTCEGKSTLTNHLATKTVTEIRHSARSQTTGAQLFVSEACDLNIIDTEGLDGTDTTQTNRELMESLLMQVSYCLEMGASLDAIIVMWCPLKNSRSGLLKTLNCLKETFGEEVLESCVVMIQGNWKRFADELQLRQPVEEAKKGMEREFPNIPILEYNAKGSLEEQLPILKTSIGRVKPYKKDYFEKQRRQAFLNMVRGFKLKMEAKEETSQKAEFVQKYQSEMLEATKKREKTVNQRKSFWKNPTNHFFLISLGLSMIRTFFPFLQKLFFPDADFDLDGCEPLEENEPPELDEPIDSADPADCWG